jgi:putrescine transport system ATP-binding protein
VDPDQDRIVRKSGAAGARPHLQLTDIVKTFGSTRAVDGVSLDIFPGEFFALLGPSGCGKTTLLRMLAGFETPDSGHILLDGEDLTAIPPHERPVNMMFQSYALFPHMNVAENIGFGLQMQRMPKRDIKARVEEMLALVHLDHLARRKPDQLSGGQKQRVALARTQFELVNIQESLGLTFVIVTHDQEEAMTVSTRLAVMRDGQIAQLGEPHHVYEAPNSRYVAEFIGDVNILEGVVENAGSGAGSCIIRLADGGVAELGGARDLPAGAVALALRPEKIAIGRQEDSAVAAANTLDGAVEDIAYLGDMSVYNIRLDSGALVRVARTNRFRALEEPISWEDRVRLSWDGSALVVLAGG